MPAMAARCGPDRRSACLALPALLLGGCGRSPDDALRLSWWGGAGRHQATLAAVAAFERRHPGVRVKCEYMGFNGYLERLTTQLAGGAEPDVMQINWAWLAMFSKRGTGFADLHAMKGLLALDQFGAQDLATGVVQGRLNALPASYTARVLLWNRSSFDRAGLALPSTWDELFALGAPFRRALGAGAYALDGELYDMLLLAQAWVQQRHGTPFVHPTEARVAMSPAAALDWVRTYQRLVGEQVATPLPLRASLGGAEKPTEQQPDWVSGRWAGNYTWDSAIPLRASTLAPGQVLELGRFPMLAGAADSGIFGRPAVMLAVSRRSRAMRAPRHAARKPPSARSPPTQRAPSAVVVS